MKTDMNRNLLFLFALLGFSLGNLCLGQKVSDFPKSTTINSDGLIIYLDPDDHSIAATGRDKTIAFSDFRTALAIPSGGSGTVTSVGLTGTSVLTFGSPVTTSGTISITLTNESANLVFAGPASGSAAAPTFRSLVAGDLPAISFASLTGKPTTLAGYSITDPIVVTSGTYPNPSWITSLAFAKLTGVPSFLTTTGNGSSLTGITPGQIGLGNVNNTTDATKNSAIVTLTNHTIDGANNTITIRLANDVTGILPIANGGTGTNAPGIIAGANVTVTGNFPNQTIDASGGGGGVLAQYVAFLASYGDDSTGAVGDPTHPFLSAEAAYIAITDIAGWSSLSVPPVYLKFLPGDALNAGPIYLSSFAQVVYLDGWSAAACVVGAINAAAGYDLQVIGNGADRVTASPWVAGPNSLTASGIAGQFGASGANGADAGRITISDCTVAGITSQGGAGAEGSAPSGTAFSLFVAFVNGNGRGFGLDIQENIAPWDGTPSVITTTDGTGNSDQWLYAGDTNWTYLGGTGGGPYSFASFDSVQGIEQGSGASYTTDGSSNADAEILFSDGAANSGWDGNATNITVSGPAGSDVYSLISGGFAFVSGTGMSTAIPGGFTITGNIPGAGYSYATDGASNADGWAALTDGSGSSGGNGGNGGSGNQVTIKRCHVTASAVTIQGGAAGAGAGLGSLGSPGIAAPSVTAYDCEIDVSGALTTTDSSPLTAIERLCMEAGITIDSQN